ncbi:MAG TPA: BBP7 family outer membrane beta-barrel protein [Lacipirellulaceae bacterium]|nr:BBP7 family outer membrane beta-barrel protein [Lacipirellulaceae bacterium]
MALASQGALGQELMAAPSNAGAGDLPPEMGMPGELPPGATLEGETIEPMADAYAQGAGEFHAHHDPMHLPTSCPSLFESSGTWLERGFWYAEADYALINKSWDRKGLLFAFEGSTSTAPGFQPGLGQPGFGQVLALNTLLIDGSKPGADGMARVTLGRFLFRDERNRDHTAQVTYFGGGSWKQESSVQSSTAGGLQVTDFIDRVNPSFDGAESMAFDYETGFDSIETNYVVKGRLGRDQMVLQPDGKWVRTAQTSQTLSFLAGVRYVNLTDALNITAERMEDVAASEGGFYNVDTDNNLIGGQLGVGVSHETSRWSIGMTAKGGSFFNRMNLNSEFLAGPELVPSRGSTDTRENNLSFVGEVQLLGKWHLRPNLSLRAGMEVLYVDSVALAPHQVNFVPGGYEPIADDGDIFCIGSSLGIEMYR